MLTMYMLFIIFKLLDKLKLLGTFINMCRLPLLVSDEYFSKTFKCKLLLKT